MPITLSEQGRRMLRLAVEAYRQDSDDDYMPNSGDWGWRRSEYYDGSMFHLTQMIAFDFLKQVTDGGITWFCVTEYGWEFNFDLEQGERS